jgi:ribosome biogenesis GTPase
LKSDPTQSGLGLTPELARAFASHVEKGLAIGRIVAEQRGAYDLLTAEGEVRARLGRRLYNDAGARERPTAGDWVTFAGRPADGLVTVQAVLPRTTELVRLAVAGGGEPQLIAANVDVVMIVTSLNADLNLRRIERYLVTARSGGARPVILLSKIDLDGDRTAALEALAGVASGVPVHAVSARTGEGFEVLEPYLAPGMTVACIGSSGVGKSTLVNRLVGAERFATSEVGFKDKGRHTTTGRQLVRLPGGAYLLDTPGMRELGLYDAVEGLEQTFADVEALAARCRFKDCAHGSEPGCALQEAVEAGRLDAARLKSYLKLSREGRPRPPSWHRQRTKALRSQRRENEEEDT